MASDTRRLFYVEYLETRTLMAWSAYASLIAQDTAASTYSTYLGKGQTVAIIDTGIDYNNASLGGGFGKGKKVIGGYDFVDNDTNPMDTAGHGTEVAGMIAANPFIYNGTTYQGIAPQASLVALRVSSDGNNIQDSTIEKALQWVITNYKTYSISVVNLSLGSGSYTSDYTNSYYSDEFAKLSTLGIVVVAASGNSGDSSLSAGGIAYPAADKNVLAVGSVNSSDLISTFTQRNSMLDLLAPGEGVTSTKMGGGYATVDGTSFSSPIVAGLAAIVKQINPSFSVADVSSILRTSAQTNYDGDKETGYYTSEDYGRINVKYAITRAISLVKNTTTTLAGAASNVVDSVVDAYGTLYVAYYDAITKTLKFVTHLSSGAWSAPTTIDASADVGSYVSLTLDQSGKPALAYYDRTNGNLKFAAWSGISFSSTPIDTTGNVGEYASIAYDSTGQASIAYYDVTNKNLKFASYSRSTHKWTLQVLDSTGDVGAYASLSTDDSTGTNIYAIAYADTTNGDLKYTRMFAGQTWTTFTVDNLTGVANIDLTLQGGKAAIGYQDTTNTDVKYAYRNNTWFTETVASAGALGQAVSIFYDQSSNLRVAYYDRTHKASYVATRSTAGTWSSVRIGYSAAPIQSASANPFSSGADLITLDVTGKLIQLLGL